MTEVTHLLVNGCSWTYCQGLENISQQGWPRLVSNNLQIPLVNIALPGCGNGSIYRRTAEYLFKNSATNGKPLVIIAWSQDWRFEAWYLERFGKPYNQFHLVGFPHDEPKDEYERAFLENYSEEYFLRRSLLERISLINLLKSFGVPYILCNNAPSELSPVAITPAGQKIEKMFNEMRSYVNGNPYKIADIDKLTTGLPHTPCMHYGLEAQEKIGNFVTDEVKRLHPDLTLTENQFITTEEFTKNDLNFRIWKHWY